MSIGRAALLLMAVFMLSSCGSGGGGSDSGGGTGTLSLSMTDATTDRFRAVYVTIDEVQVHLPGGNENNPNSWQSAEMTASPMTVNLLDLVNGVREDLGVADLNEGSYTQMRLIIGKTPEPNSINILSQAHPFANYVIDWGDPPNVYELKIPSGFQSGYKIVAGFDINANETTELILDFYACDSVVEAGNSGQWLLKPTVKIRFPDDPQEFSIISGQVSTPPPQGSPPSTPNSDVEGAIVSAQLFDGGATADATDDQLTVQASTVTDSDGKYQLFVRPGDYNLVVFKAAKNPGFKRVQTTSDELKTGQDFVLEGASTGTVTGSVTIASVPDANEQYVTLSFRQPVDCVGIGGCAADEMIEIYSINIRDGSSYSVTLPEGDYTLVASSFGFTNKAFSITIPLGGTVTQPISF